MVHPWAVIYGLLIFWIAFNAILFPVLDKKTKYKGNTQGDIDNVIIWWILIFGPLMFLFIPTLRRKRMHRYLRKRIQYLKWCDHGFVGNKMKDEYIFTHRIEKMERILKISMIQQKSKRNKIKKLLLLK